MTGWEHMGFGVGRILREGELVRPEDFVALAPDGQRWNLAGAVVLMELRVMAAR
ncbi:hypothetical protein ACFQ9Z_16295 [Streptomyces sp. NPDC056580]|uniref:hypothetical protein n=1 Tax=Streptomyces sp. NPDC056580 TaxID=3345872 RepID=UPI0036B368F8